VRRSDVSRDDPGAEKDAARQEVIHT